MIWLASFPRSGNTFFRNVLFEVYGIKSSTFHLDPTRTLDDNYTSYPVVKTHQLPSELQPLDSTIKAAYIIRDGRDTVVSLAHHRKDIVAPGSDFTTNLKAAILAEKGSFFGGWSTNVERWIDRADLIIRYEDLIKDPILCTERLRAILDLPEARQDALPSFSDLKFGIPKYGVGAESNLSEEEKLRIAKQNFRKGKAGGWREELPQDLHDLFWSIHGETMEKAGYTYEGEVLPAKSLHPDFDYSLQQKLIVPKVKAKETNPPKKRVLLDGEKIIHTANDGVKRYALELFKRFLTIQENSKGAWSFDILFQRNIYSILDVADLIKQDLVRPPESSSRNLFKFLKILFLKVLEGIAQITPFALRQWVRRNIGTPTQVPMHVMDEAPRRKDLLSEAALKEKCEEYDLIHILLPQHFFFFPKLSTPKVVTVHDCSTLLFPGFHKKANIDNHERGMRHVIENKASVITVSGSTASDVTKNYDIAPADVFPVPLGVNRLLFRTITNQEDGKRILKKYNIPPTVPYLLCLSTIEPRKNLENTIKAFQELKKELGFGLRVNLVVAGKKGWKVNSQLGMQLRVFNSVIPTGFINDEDLPYLYYNALALSYISHYEGFGLPLLEAMNCGCPVIYGNNSSQVEIVGDAGLAADPNDILDIKEKFKQICKDDSLRTTLRERSLARASRYSWRKTTVDTLAVYDQLIARHQSKAE